MCTHRAHLSRALHTQYGSIETFSHASTSHNNELSHPGCVTLVDGARYTVHVARVKNHLGLRTRTGTWNRARRRQNLSVKPIRR